MKKTILILLLIGITIGTIVSDVYSKYVLDKSINAVSLEASTLYNIEYNLKGGTISGEPLKYTVNHSLTLPNPIKMGYNFTGWTGENGTLPQTNVIIVKGSIGNKSYTANWKTTNYTISYNLNGGNLATTNNYNIETNTFGLGVPTKTGYTFTGWTGSNGTTPQININIV
ncbi:MAG: InlB B-repeat-containing protein, partial [Clostridia bacterium]